MPDRAAPLTVPLVTTLVAAGCAGPCRSTGRLPVELDRDDVLRASAPEDVVVTRGRHGTCVAPSADAVTCQAGGAAERGGARAPRESLRPGTPDGGAGFAPA